MDDDISQLPEKDTSSAMGPRYRWPSPCLIRLKSKFYGHFTSVNIYQALKATTQRLESPRFGSKDQVFLSIFEQQRGALGSGNPLYESSNCITESRTGKTVMAIYQTTYQPYCICIMREYHFLAATCIATHFMCLCTPFY